MRRLYYFLGFACFAASALIFSHTFFPAEKIANNVLFEADDSGFEETYHIGFAMPKNGLRRGTVYLPEYSEREEACMRGFAAHFGMGDVFITEQHDFFEAQDADGVLRMYKYIDYLEFENLAERHSAEAVTDCRAAEIAQSFLNKNLPGGVAALAPFDVKVSRDDSHITVKLISYLSNLPNHAFPTEVVMDFYGNMMSAKHFYFEYEALDHADVITMRAALGRLPDDVDKKIHLTGYQLIYDFEHSVLMPVYRFWGHAADGTDFEWDVSALKFY